VKFEVGSVVRSKHHVWVKANDGQWLTIPRYDGVLVVVSNTQKDEDFIADISAGYLFDILH